MDERLNQFLSDKGVTLTDEQYTYVYDVCFGENHLCNWSVAGSGKSLCLELIKEFLGDTCIVVAMTGIANSILFNNIGGQGTLHSAFSIPLGIHNDYHEKKVGSTTSELFAKSDLVTTVIVEESGMLNPDQLELVRKRIERYNRPYGKKRRRRNIKLVLQGDLLQLGAILSDEEKEYISHKYGSYFLPESSVYKNMGFKTHIFTKVMRTKDKVFQAALDVIRYGEERRYDKCLQWLNKRYQPAPEGIPVVTTTNKKVDEINRRELEKNPNPLFTLKPKISGKYNIKNCPVDEVVYVKVGSPVLILINDNIEGKYFNGTFGYVSKVVVGEGLYVDVVSSGETVFVPMFEFEEREYFTDVNKETGEDFLNQKIIGTCLHYCVKLASCLSCHRVQGKTLDTPYLLDLGWGFPQSQDNDWGYQLAYVTLSRATDVNNIYLAQRLTHKHLKVNRKAVNWVLNNN